MSCCIVDALAVIHIWYTGMLTSVGSFHVGDVGKEGGYRELKGTKTALLLPYEMEQSTNLPLLFPLKDMEPSCIWDKLAGLWMFGRRGGRGGHSRSCCTPRFSRLPAMMHHVCKYWAWGYGEGMYVSLSAAQTTRCKYQTSTYICFLYGIY